MNGLIYRLCATTASCLLLLSCCGKSASFPKDQEITVAVRYVALQEFSLLNPRPSRDEVDDVFFYVNAIWAQCGIKILVEEYLPVIASNVGLSMNPKTYEELDQERKAFETSDKLAIIVSGFWFDAFEEYSGFASLPGDDPEGICIENISSLDPRIIAHEIGHAMGGLQHLLERTNVMNPEVYLSSVVLTPNQCDLARETLLEHRPKWVRK